ncbi:hypothetical protein DMENIID0001_158080 [Sergentomyia squamirostris]
MSWLNLDSLNTIKGQITKVIQETVVQQPQQDEDEIVDYVVKLEAAAKKIDELTELCSTQDQELAILRKQNLELQQQQQHVKVAECGAGKSTQDHNVPIDDSWFWETDNNTSSSSSKNEEILSKSPSGGDLTIIPLDQTSDTDSVERHQRKFEEIESKLKKANLENALLGEKIKQLTGENRDLNENIEELDKQHAVIVENLLTQKNQFQEQLNQLKSSSDELMKLKKDMVGLTEKHEKMESAYVTSVQDNVTIKAQMEAINAELRRAVCENVELVATIEVKNDELKKLLNEKEKLQREFQDFVVKMTEERGNETSTVKQLMDKIQFLEEDVQKSSTYSNEIKENVIELTEQLEKVTLEKEQVEQEYKAYQESVHELKKNSTDSQKLQDQELQDMKKKFPALEDELSKLQQSLKNSEDVCQALEIENKQLREDLIAIQEDDLNLQREFHTLQEQLKATDQICVEKKQLEQDFVALQEDDLQLQRDYNDLKEKCRCLEEQFNTSNTVFEEKLNDLINKCDQVAKERDQVKIERKQIEQDFIALQEDDLNLQREVHTLKEQQNNDNAQKMIEDNNNLQRQIIDLQSKINSQNAENVGDVKISSSQIFELLKTFGRVSNETGNVYNALEDHLRSSNDVKIKLESVEKRLTEALTSNNQQKEEIRKLDHEKKTIQADLMHYEIECNDLMKNNEILLQELEELKTGKLETIQENSEESVAMLEKQLEECNMINQSLENDCQMLNSRIDQMEQEQEDLMSKITCLEKDLSEKTSFIAELKNQIGSLENERSNLQFELTELKVDEPKSVEPEQLEKFHKEISDLQNEVTSLKSDKDNLIADLQKVQGDHTKSHDEFHIEIDRLKSIVEGMTKEKNELINLITVKHNESVQYHTEIQRLSQLLQQEVTKNASCTKCQESEHLLARLPELEKLPDHVECLKEKANLLTNSLLTEQQTVKTLTKEKQDLHEEKIVLIRDLERLRQHLLTVEEDQTAQMVELQRQTEEYKNKLTLLEQEAQKSSTAYTSASIRANQHAETLQAQYMLLSQQRDDLSTKLSSAEDRESKNQAALINLQCALEQFQRDKDRDVEATTFRIRKQLEEERKVNQDILNEMKSLQNQLAEAKTGLLAASRISDQLEASQATLSAHKEETKKLQDKCSKLEQKIYNSEVNQADKVEKTLIKNLVIGYVSAPNVGDKSQILKLISAVLDFNQNESDRIGLKSTQNWPTPGGDEAQGLAQAFVKFLEKESQPRQPPTAASLLNISHVAKKPASPSGASSQQSAAKTAEVPSTTPTSVQPILLSENILQALSPPRNSSTILKDILNDT